MPTRTLHTCQHELWYIVPHLILFPIKLLSCPTWILPSSALQAHNNSGATIPCCQSNKKEASVFCFLFLLYALHTCSFLRISHFQFKCHHLNPPILGPPVHNNKAVDILPWPQIKQRRRQFIWLIIIPLFPPQSLFSQQLSFPIKLLPCNHLNAPWASWYLSLQTQLWDANANAPSYIAKRRCDHEHRWKFVLLFFF